MRTLCEIETKPYHNKVSFIVAARVKAGPPAREEKKNWICGMNCTSF